VGNRLGFFAHRRQFSIRSDPCHVDRPEVGA
jgi:hypothetical protein